MSPGHGNSVRFASAAMALGSPGKVPVEAALALRKRFVSLFRVFALSRSLVMCCMVLNFPETETLPGGDSRLNRQQSTPAHSAQMKVQDPKKLVEHLKPFFVVFVRTIVPLLL